MRLAALVMWPALALYHQNIWAAPPEGSQTSAAGPAIDFETQIYPLLQTRCFQCHGPQKQQGGLRFDTLATVLASRDSGEPAVVPGDPAASQMLVRVTSTDAESQMPPNGDRLAPDQVSLLTAWVKAGAVWPEKLAKPSASAATDQVELTVSETDRAHWAYRPLAPVPVPQANLGESGGWCAHSGRRLCRRTITATSVTAGGAQPIAAPSFAGFTST